MRERFFTPRLKVKSYDELNAWLVDKCLAWAKAHAHPEQSERTIWEVFEGTAEAHRISQPFRQLPQRAGVRVETVPRSLRQQPLFGERERRRAGGGNPDLRRSRRHSPGWAGCRRAPAQVWPRRDGLRPLALCSGVGAQARRPSQRRAVQGLGLPAALDRVRRKLAGSNDGDRQMVKILAAVLSDGLSEVEAACGQALAEGVHSADVVLNILARRRQPPVPAPIATPASLALRQPPIADCARYDSLRSA